MNVQMNKAHGGLEKIIAWSLRPNLKELRILRCGIWFVEKTKSLQSERETEQNNT